MQPHLIPPSSLFSFFFCFFVFCNLLTSLSADYKGYTECGAFQFPCGNKTYPISYPFGVQNSAPLCFVPGYSFTCENDSLVLEMDSVPYVVNEIDYKKNILTIVKKEFLDQTCPYTNTTINQYLFNYTNQVRNLTVFYDCSTTVSSPPSGFQNFPCLANAFFTVQTVDQVPNPFISCRVSTISIFHTAVVDIESNPNVFGDKVEEGFNVTWTAGTQWCEECQNSGGRCGYNESTPFEPTCFCKYGSFQASCPPDYEGYTQCAPSQFPCGDKTYKISYPFGDSDSAPFCFVPAYSFTCEDGSLVLEMDSVPYVVYEIDYEKNILTIVKKEFVGDACPFTNTTINQYLFSYTDQVRNLTVFYNCSATISPPAGFQNVPCLGNAFFTDQAESVDQVPNPYISCLVSIISIFQTAVVDIESNPRVFEDKVKEGFIVTWTIDTKWCEECENSGGRCGYNESAPLNPTCFCKDGSFLASCPTGGEDDNNRKSNGKAATKNRKIAIGAGIGGLSLMCFFFFTFGSLFSHSYPYMQKFTFSNRNCFLKKKTNDSYNVELFLMNYGSQALKRHSYSNIKKITNSFKEKLGRGGFGSVFKGKLSDGRLVAVKILEESKGNGEEFINEVASIGRTYHVNIVPLLGFCSEGSKRALIYEFMPNGSLEKFIYTDKPKAEHPLGWKKLYDIALGIARGLEYLHRGCTMRILHFDIKPHNILLDQDFCPKISDFGLAKSCPTKESIVSMSIARGTVGYIAPEVYCRNFGGVSYKSDVYSYGMMILEMVGGRKNIDALVENTSEIFFPQWVYGRLELHQDLGLHGLVSQVEEEIARKMITVGLWCIQTNPTDRPWMGRAIEMLEGSLESLPMPPNPILYSPSTPSEGCSVALR